MAYGDIATHRHPLTKADSAKGGRASKGVPKRRIDRLFRAIEKAQGKKITITDESGKTASVDRLEAFADNLLTQMANGDIKAARLYVDIVTNGEPKHLEVQEEKKEPTMLDAMMQAFCIENDLELDTE